MSEWHLRGCVPSGLRRKPFAKAHSESHKICIDVFYTKIVQSELKANYLINSNEFSKF